MTPEDLWALAWRIVVCLIVVWVWVTAIFWVVPE
jgi:hypothetical protein